MSRVDVVNDRACVPALSFKVHVLWWELSTPQQILVAIEQSKRHTLDCVRVKLCVKANICRLYVLPCVPVCLVDFMP